MSTPDPIPTPPPPRGPDYQRAAQDALARSKAAAQDALSTFMKLIYNPVGALPDAYRSLAPPQAIGVGVVFILVAVICLLVAGGGVISMLGGVVSSSMGFKGFLMGLGVMLGVAAGIAAGSFLARMIFRGEGNLAFDIFIGGAALLPLGLGALVSYLLGLIGIGGVIGQLPMLVGVSLTILVIFTGLARVAGLKEGLSSYLVAVVLSVGILVGYLIGRMLGGMLF
jgi:hypothetical protein